MQKIRGIYSREMKNDLIAFIEDLEKHNDFDEEIKMMRMYLRLAKRD